MNRFWAWWSEVGDAAKRCARLGHVVATEWREGYRRSNASDWRYYPAVAVSNKRATCSRCRAALGEWKETRSDGFDSVTWPSEYWREFEDKGERWTRSWIEAGGEVDPPSSTIMEFGYVWTANGPVLSRRQLVEVLDGQGWRWENDTEFRARVLKLESAKNSPSPEALKEFAWAFGADGSVVVRQLVKLAEGETAPHTIADEISQLAPPEGWRYETDAEFRARVLALAKEAKQ